jgi:signal transduction histidine kinase
MPQKLIAAGVGEALREFASRINQSGSLYLEVSFFDIDQRLEEVQEISLYRIS